MRMRLMCFLCPALVLAQTDAELSFSGQPRTDRPQMVKTTPAGAIGERLRVASYNIENFTDAVRDGEARTRELMQAQAKGAAALIARMDPDLLVIQEIENAASLNALNAALGNRYPVAVITQFGEHERNGEKLNLAALSRVPVKESIEIDFAPLQGKGRPTRGLLRLRIELADHAELVVYVVHLKSNFGHGPRNIFQRRAALELLRKDFDALRQAQAGVRFEVLVLGDTNVDPESPQFAADTSFEPLKAWIDVWRGQPIEKRMTMPTRKGIPEREFPPVTFDRFFVSPELTNQPWRVAGTTAVHEGVNTADAEAAPGSPSHISDHYPVYIDLAR